MSDAEPEIARIAALIQEIGYRAQITETSIRTAMSGWSVLVFVFPGVSIQMYSGITVNAEDGFGLEQANRFNSGYRFSKCYLREGMVALEQDFYFNVSQPDAKAVLERIFFNWEASISVFKGAHLTARQHHAASAEPPPPPS